MLRRTTLRALVSLPEKTVTQAQIVGWSHLPFGKFGSLDLESLVGGLKAKGHSIGATGVSMHVLACMQLTGTAADIQSPVARLGAVFNMGGYAVTSCASILEAAR